MIQRSTSWITWRCLMPLPKGHRVNFQTLSRAFENDSVCLMECTDKATNKPVHVICAVQPAGQGSTIEIVPLAKMFDGNPYDEVNPPQA